MHHNDANGSAGGVQLAIDGAIAVVTIDRPEVRNAIGSATIAELGAALDQIGDSDAAVVVLRGAGDRVFVSGGDLKELTAVRSYDDAVRMASRARQLLDRVAAFPVPVVAALNGHAFGGGAEVAIAADIRIAADDVKIGFNQVSLGIMPAWGGAERLAQVIGRGRALLAIASGRLYDAPSALELGLVGHARNLADGRVEVVAQGDPGAVRQLEELLREEPSTTRRPGSVVSVVGQPGSTRDDLIGFVER